MTLKKHFLDYEPTFKYVSNNFERTNTISVTSLESIDFKKGKFFTLLPPGSNLERLYEFEAGVILPQNPDIEYISDRTGKPNSYSLIPKINEELSDLLFNISQSKKEFTFVFDDVTRSPDTKHGKELTPYKYAYDKELCYIIDSASVSSDLIWSGLRASNAFWHSLCILTTANLNILDHTLSIEIIREICLRAKLLIIGAYDSETFVFWEKEGYNFFEVNC